VAKTEICRSSAALLLVSALVAESGCLRQNQAPSARGPEPATAQMPLPSGAAPNAAVSNAGMSQAAADAGLLHVEPSDTPSGVFMQQGKPFCFAGSNNYYLTFKDKAMVDDVFIQAKALGLKVLRTWSFIDRGSLDDSVPSTDRNQNDPPGTKGGVYFQYWDPRAKTTAYNEGAERDDGLVRLDYVLAKAAENDIKIVLVLTNNWKEFGGMDQYLRWFGLKWHHEFFTSPKARAAYKHYAEHLINRVNTITKVRYKEDPTIFAWELANEPRCRNFGKYDHLEDCKADTLTKWVKEMSGYIKSIDPNHMVAVGDEGFFNRPGQSSERYNGADGVDHEAYLALDSVDYGTFHLYPDTWATGLEWGNTWITDHIEAAQKAGKPTVLEEYGVVIKRDDKTGKVTNGLDRRRIAYTNWNQLMLERGGNAAMFWLLVGIDPSNPNTGYYQDYDHFSVYNLADDASAQLLRGFSERFTEHARACELATKAGLSVPASPFVSALRRTGIAQVQPGPARGLFAER
jgi:mannan endo-1,4-beta-mannosidase